MLTRHIQILPGHYQPYSGIFRNLCNACICRNLAYLKSWNIPNPSITASWYIFKISDFQYGFKSSRSTADLLTVVSDRTARAFNKSGATRAVAVHISKAFDRVWNAGLLHKIKSHGISGQIFFCLISSFLSNRRLRVGLDGKSSKEYPVNAGIPQGYILGPTLFLLYIDDLTDNVICNIAIYTDLYVIHISTAIYIWYYSLF